MRRLVFSIALLVLFARCAPVTATSQLTVTPQDAMRCAGDTLASLGYSVTDERAVDGVLQGERDKHARIPYAAQADWDRITVMLGTSKKQPALRVVGETMRSAGSHARFGAARGQLPGSDFTQMPVHHFASAEVRDDTKRIAETCAGAPSEKASDNGAETNGGEASHN